MMFGQEAKKPETQPPRAIAGHSPALIWLSLAGLRPRRAQRRFTRRRPYILCALQAEKYPPNAPTGSTASYLHFGNLATITVKPHPFTGWF